MKKHPQEILPSLSHRPRRLRRLPGLRRMVRQVRLHPSDLVLPLFVRPGKGIRRPIRSMPGVHQWSVDRLEEIIAQAVEARLPAVILFGIPASKDARGSESHDPQGIVQQAIRAIKSLAPELVVISDVCLCEYTDHGHCGLLNAGDPLPDPNLPPGEVLNDPTLELLAKVALSHAQAGADMVAPSGMMDGMVGAIRQALDQGGFSHVPILSYAVKYASAFYGPFREAAESPPKFGDRRGHQMDPANAHRALLEAELDLQEGADMLMVKPAVPYLDVLGQLHQRYPQIPLAAYHVSGEYAMLKAAAANGWLDERRTVMETLTAIKRAGAQVILTYYALQAACWSAEGWLD